jgi:hypothetical protein
VCPRPVSPAGWIFEEKIDGWRMLACKDGPSVGLESRKVWTTRDAFLISPLPWPRYQVGRSSSTVR